MVKALDGLSSEVLHKMFLTLNSFQQLLFNIQITTNVQPKQILFSVQFILAVFNKLQSITILASK